MNDKTEEKGPFLTFYKFLKGKGEKQRKKNTSLLEAEPPQGGRSKEGLGKS